MNQHIFTLVSIFSHVSTGGLDTKGVHRNIKYEMFHDISAYLIYRFKWVISEISLEIFNQTSLTNAFWLILWIKGIYLVVYVVFSYTEIALAAELNLLITLVFILKHVSFTECVMQTYTLCKETPKCLYDQSCLQYEVHWLPC